MVWGHLRHIVLTVRGMIRQLHPDAMAYCVLGRGHQRTRVCEIKRHAVACLPHVAECFANAGRSK
jgi:hypothetical protein